MKPSYQIVDAKDSQGYARSAHGPEKPRYPPTPAYPLSMMSSIILTPSNAMFNRRRGHFIGRPAWASLLALTIQLHRAGGTMLVPRWSRWRVPQGQVVDGNAGSAKGRTKTLSQCPSHPRLPLTGSIPLKRASEPPSLNGLDYRLPYPCLFSETCATMHPTRQTGYKKRNLLGVNLGEKAPQNRFLSAAVKAGPYNLREGEGEERWFSGRAGRKSVRGA
jgi:hypothetical protein